MTSAADLRAGRVLVSTLHSPDGGVPEMVRFATGVLKSRGLEPVLAYYKPYSIDPELSVPSFRLLSRRVGSRVVTTPERFEAHEMGAWLPELEFTTYAPTAQWTDVIASCRYHVVVSGSFLASRPLLEAGVPVLSWLATPWNDDRSERVRRFPPLRRIVDSVLIQPVTSRLERDLLRRANVLALSSYTKQALDRIAGSGVVRGVLPMPIDTARFVPCPEQVRPWTVGFAGRLADPRKNVGLLLEAVRLCREAGKPARAVLIGGPLLDDPGLERQRAALGDAVEVHPYKFGDEFVHLVQSLDALFIPSRQEGLCIAALQAMSAGCPIVSTRCGGPEEFVSGDVGALVGFDAREAADALMGVMSDRARRDGLAARARGVVEDRYSREAAERIFWSAFESVMGAEGR